MQCPGVVVVQRRVVDERVCYALEGRATDTYLKTRRNRRSAEDDGDVCEDLLAISRAGLLRDAFPRS